MPFGWQPVKMRFGDCVLDTETRELLRAGARVDLTPKAYELLELLLRERPKALSKAEIRDRLWPKTFVSDVTLTTLAFDVRKAIGDEARRLRTVRKYGYAFAAGEADVGGAPVREAGCRLLTEDREFPLAEGEHVIGRGSEADVVLDRSRVSRRHACVRIAQGATSIEDLGSKNGTFVSGRRVHREEPIKDGDEIRIGSVCLIFRASSRAAATETGDSGS